MVLVGLDKVEVSTLSDSETIVTIKLELSINNGVNTRGVSEAGPVVGSFTGSSVENPYKFLDWVVERKLGLDSRVAVRFSSSELELFNEVFVFSLSELSTFVSVEVDVVNPEGSVGKGWSSWGNATSRKSVTFSNWSELDVNLDFVVLESNKRKS